MIYTLYLYEDEPPLVREADPGQYVALHLRRVEVAGFLNDLALGREFDFVATVGFDFTELDQEVQNEVRRLMRLESAVVRLDRV